MTSICINFVLVTLSCVLCIYGQGHPPNTDETVLVSQIIGPSDNSVRNLSGLMLSMNVYHKGISIYNSQRLLTTNTFPLNYSIALADHHFEPSEYKDLNITGTIWQPAYLFNDRADSPVLHTRPTKLMTIRGEIEHRGKRYLPTSEITLIFVEDKGTNEAVSQVDVTCAVDRHSCSFEYQLDLTLVRANIPYKLQAIPAGARKRTDQQQKNGTSDVKLPHQRTFKIRSTGRTEINDYKVFLTD